MVVDTGARARACCLSTKDNTERAPVKGETRVSARNKQHKKTTKKKTKLPAFPVAPELHPTAAHARGHGPKEEKPRRSQIGADSGAMPGARCAPAARSCGASCSCRRLRWAWVWRASSWELWASAGSGGSTGPSRGTPLRCGAECVYVTATTSALSLLSFMVLCRPR